MALLLAYRLAGPLWPTGPGDRLPASPTPGAVPRGEPLLPRLETLLYALTPHAKIMGARVNHVETCEEMLEEIVRTLFGPEAIVTGPLLLAGTRHNPRLYINVATHLLDLDALDEYVEIAYTALEVLNDPNPSRRRRTLSEVKARIEELEENGLLVPWETLAKRRQRTALRLDTKTPSHGMLFAETRIDYQILAHLNRKAGDVPGAALQPTLILVVFNAHPENAVALEHSTALLTPSKTPALLKTICAGFEPLGNDDDTLIALTPTPVDETKGEAVHPLLTKTLRLYSRLTVLASSCRVHGKYFTKTKPKLAHHSGTVYLVPRGTWKWERRISHAVPVNLLLNIKNIVKMLNTSGM